MGEWTVHVDAPEGTSLEGTSEVAFKLLDELSGIEGVADIEPSVGVSANAGSPTHIHFLCQALPIEERKNTQAEIITEMRRRLASLSELPAEHQLADRARQRRGHRRVRHRGEHPRARSQSDREYSKKALAAAQNVPSITEVKIGLNVSNPEVHVAVDRKRAADLGVRMATIGNTLRLAVSGDDQISFFKEGQEQYPVKIRVLESQRGDIAEIGRLTVPSATGPGPHRQHRPARARPRSDHAAAFRPAVHGQSDRRRGAGPRARRSVERRPQRCWPGSTCRRRCRSGCRDSRRSSTRRPPT